MAEGLNRVTLIGNLGQDPELRYTQSNQGVLSVRIATTESYFDNNTKERKERTEWHSVIIWGKRGEALNKLLSKGSRICIEGRLQTRSWEDQQGTKRYSTEVVASNVVLLGGGSRREDHHDQGPADHGGAYDGTHDNEPGTDDIPF
jgi:single-strand DNA-binding protein